MIFLENFFKRNILTVKHLSYLLVKQKFQWNWRMSSEQVHLYAMGSLTNDRCYKHFLFPSMMTYTFFDEIFVLFSKCTSLSTTALQKGESRQWENIGFHTDVIISFMCYKGFRGESISNQSASVYCQYENHKWVVIFK